MLPVLTALLLATACTTPTDAEPAPERPGPLVAEDVVRLDLREAPTREEGGFAEGRNSLVLERVGAALDVEVVLPAGTLQTDAFGVVLAGPLDATAGDHVATVMLNRRLPDLSALEGELRQEAAVLGLAEADIAAFVDQVGSPPSRADGRVLVSSSERPWIDLEARYDETEQDWGLDYAFSFDQPPLGSVGTPS